MSDKLFVLRIRERNGELQYEEDIFTIAPDKETAEDWAREYIKEWYFESDVYNKNEHEDSLWWTYESDNSEITWEAVRLEETYELRDINHTEGCENNNSRVKLVIE